MAIITVGASANLSPADDVLISVERPLSFDSLCKMAASIPSKKIATGFEVGVPIFVAQGDKVEIDTRTGEYRKRV